MVIRIGIDLPDGRGIVSGGKVWEMARRMNWFYCATNGENQHLDGFRWQGFR
jgi:hypothetical protein